MAVVVPVALYLATVWLLHAPLGEGYRASVVPMSAGHRGDPGGRRAGAAGLPLPWVVVLVAVPPAVLVAIHRDHNPSAAPVD